MRAALGRTDAQNFGAFPGHPLVAINLGLQLLKTEPILRVNLLIKPCVSVHAVAVQHLAALGVSFNYLIGATVSYGRVLRLAEPFETTILQQN